MDPSVTTDKPVIVQNDHTLLLETGGPAYEEARDLLVPFAELVKAPEYVHTYRLTALSLWNAASAGHAADDVLGHLARLSRFPVPANVADTIRTQMARYGRLRLVREGPAGPLLLVADDPTLLDEALASDHAKQFLGERRGDALLVAEDARGRIKQALVEAGWPVEDLAGFREGSKLNGVSLRAETQDGRPFALRDYQKRAVDAFHQDGSPRGGSGVVALPCGAGKTIVGLEALCRTGQHTLIVTSGSMAVRQWERELIDKTTISPMDICELTGSRKELGPVTLTTYQMLTHRKGAARRPKGAAPIDTAGEGEPEPAKRRGARGKTSEGGDEDAAMDRWPTLERVRAHPWGLIIYDEVHLLPAPVFRMACEIQATRRLGLTATLVREDGRAAEVFSLIGPKRYDVPWKVLEQKGWIAQASCTEVRVPLPEARRREYATTPQKEKFRVAATSPAKLDALVAILERHRLDQVLVIGSFLEQLGHVADLSGAPRVTGETPARERQRLCDQFRAGELKLLLLSSVGNYALDLPEASVLIQVSGMFGSRQEEAQRLGRVLRPKQDGRAAAFYTLVTEGTVEGEFAMNRQRFLTEQGYRYRIVDAAALLNGAP